ncbi:hypothetical protein [Halalkalibacillus halophilus]|uniref:hypothetical protein n=1 Tax=Halalkalibacillus halophilus TaxID=392827 RepID=UPI0003F9501B|nr:hypothetical protein [Halalkalibacillus halophilus]
MFFVYASLATIGIILLLVGLSYLAYRLMDEAKDFFVLFTMMLGAFILGIAIFQSMTFVG